MPILEKSVTLEEMSKILDIPLRRIQRHRNEGEIAATGSGHSNHPFRVRWSEFQRYAKLQGVILADDESKTKSNGHRNGNGTKYDVESLISTIATGDPANAKVAKDQAQALKLALEIQKRRKEDGELISIDQYRANIARLGQKVRNLYMGIADGFLASIDGMTAPQIQNELELRLESFGKQLAELEWEEDDEG